MVRPRKVLEDLNYDAGPANVDPLSKENGGDLLANSASSNPPFPSQSTGSQAPDRDSLGVTSVAGAATEAPKDSNTLWIALGAAAAAIVIGGVGVGVMRARRARRHRQP
jgi:hypothetical protein